MNNSYLIPANAKKGTLIFNLFRLVDLIIFLIGLGVSILLLSIFSTSNLTVTILCCIPGGVCSLLVLPIPNYHNVLCTLQTIFRFYSYRRKFIWKGWCFNEVFKDSKSK